MSATYEHSYFAEHGGGDEATKRRIAADAERERHDRLAAVRVIAGYALDAAEARDLFGALGLTDAEVREARLTPVTTLPTAAATAAGTATAPAATAPARRGRKVSAA